MKVDLEINAVSGDARACTVRVGPYEVRTPVFMPVGTVGAVKNLTPAEVKRAGADIILANTYHLILRPGAEVIERAGGIGRFMRWEGPVLTDSGGFQVFSLGRIRKLTPEGVLFNSHVDGAPVFLSPETVYRTQSRMGSTIAMPLDVCPDADAGAPAMSEALELTTRWLDETVAAREPEGPALFGIFQGGTDHALRRRHLEEIAGRDVDGVAIGGLSVGEDREKTLETISAAAPAMPADRPRYLMGMGKPREILHSIARGVDMFDCVLPTRGARHGLVFSSKGSYSIRAGRWKEDSGPLDPGCECEVCKTFDRRYLRHLHVSGETLGGRLLSLHNVTFYLSLLERARNAILCYKFDEFMRHVLHEMSELDENPETRGQQ